MIMGTGLVTLTVCFLCTTTYQGVASHRKLVTEANAKEGVDVKDYCMLKNGVRNQYYGGKGKLTGATRINPEDGAKEYEVRYNDGLTQYRKLEGLRQIVRPEVLGPDPSIGKDTPSTTDFALQQLRQLTVGDECEAEVSSGVWKRALFAQEILDTGRFTVMMLEETTSSGAKKMCDFPATQVRGLKFVTTESGGSPVRGRTSAKGKLAEKEHSRQKRRKEPKRRKPHKERRAGSAMMRAVKEMPLHYIDVDYFYFQPDQN